MLGRRVGGNAPRRSTCGPCARPGSAPPISSHCVAVTLFVQRYGRPQEAPLQRPVSTVPSYAMVGRLHPCAGSPPQSWSRVAKVFTTPGTQMFGSLSSLGERMPSATKPPRRGHLRPVRVGHPRTHSAGRSPGRAREWASFLNSEEPPKSGRIPSTRESVGLYSGAGACLLYTGCVTAGVVVGEGSLLSIARF